MRDKNHASEIVDEVASTIAPRIPVSTYRLQFNADFTFSDAIEILPYLNSLGITDIYASPYFKAQPGSVHGYDVIDHNSFNRELGSEDDYASMSTELKTLGMGHIADIVPNHMSITGSGNAWWNDVLENGPCSPYSNFFDIDWKPIKEELEDKVILPILGGQYGDVLEKQELKLSFEDGAFFVRYWEHRLPLDPSTYGIVLTHRQDDIREKLTLENPDYQKFLVIMTALKNLPPRTERNPDRIAARLKEREAAKDSLRQLYGSSPEIRNFIDENVRIFNGVPGEPESFDLLDGLLSAQAYRLSFWRVATEEINYRRFFDINDLGAIRMEDEQVFDECHRLVFGLIRDGHITGLRVDHPDGLYDPEEYFRRLQEGCFLSLCARKPVEKDYFRELKEAYKERLANNPEGEFKKPFYVVGEKILMESERLSPEWPIFGTTGYGFMNSVNAVLIDSSSAKAIDNNYTRFTKHTAKFSELFYTKKKLIMETSMSSEINVLGHSLNKISERDRHFRDFTLNSLTDAIIELIAFFPVYRTYITPESVSESDRRYIDVATSKAKRRSRDINPQVFDFIKSVLVLDYPRREDPELKRECLDFTMKFQQLTGPVMAKGIEDTAFYNYNRLMSLNEVGGNPDRLGMTVDAFHGQNIERQKHWPHTLIATSTHDSKRSEDVRARINVITELPLQWRECVIRWARLNRKFKRNLEGQPVPDRNEEYLLYQTLIGAWPIDDAYNPRTAEFADRIKQYMVKAVREAKTNSSWLNPNAEYEDALSQFIDKILGSPQFLDDFRRFQQRVSHVGMFNSLSQSLLKIASPGVPDFYQGTETWTFTLVDPDNRAPVDYGLRMKLMEGIKAMETSMDRSAIADDMVRTKEDGRIKLYVTYRALNFIRENQRLFYDSEYVPLHVSGKLAEHVIAFGYFGPGTAAITVVPRLIAGLIGPGETPHGGIWEDTLIHLPTEIAATGFRNVFTDEIVTIGHTTVPALPAAGVFKRFPVAMLEAVS